MLKIIDTMPFKPLSWPGNWVWADDEGSGFEVVQFCCCFSRSDLPARLHISADNRYKIYFNGEFGGLGPQRGNFARYFFDTYDLSQYSDSAQCIVSVIVWHDRDYAPSAQITSRPAFLGVAEYAGGGIVETPRLWKYNRWQNNRTIPVPEDAYCIGTGYDMPGFTSAQLCPTPDIIDNLFKPVKAMGYSREHQQGHPQLLMHWNLRPRTIPAMEARKGGLGKCRRVECDGQSKYRGDLSSDISKLAEGCGANQAVILPAGSRYKIILDNQVLTAGYPCIAAAQGQGAVIKVTYQEAMQSGGDVRSKGNRDEVGQRNMVGVYDIFRPVDNHLMIFEPLWWRCWRYIELDIQCGNAPLELRELSYRSTGYPLELKAKIKANDWFERLIEPGFRTMRLCANETYMDCPYYEQLQYIGDTRIQALLSYSLCNDDRLGREAIEFFGLSIDYDGLTWCSYPNRYKQSIPLFSLIYIPMLKDFVLWRGDIDFIRPKLAYMDTILRTFEGFTGNDGLIGKLPGWAFIDWSKDEGWKNGEPPAANTGGSFLVSFFYLYALTEAVHLCNYIGDDKRASIYKEKSDALRNILRAKAFDETRGVFADEADRLHFSEHTNILAVLTNTNEGVIDSQTLLKNIIARPGAARATVYFKFYLYEAMYKAGCADLIWPDFKLWHDMIDNGLTTFAERPEPTRSDCHAWSAHPLYHFAASVMGIRPASAGCATMSFNPLPKTDTVPPLPDILSVCLETVRGRYCAELTASGEGWTANADFAQSSSVRQQ